MTTLAVQITDAGPIGPDYADILQQLKIAYWSIYGSDSALDDDTQDGQLLAVFAQSLYDTGQAVIGAYNAYAPSTAQGVGLASVVKINGLRKQAASRSSVVVRLVGVVGTPIVGALVGDALGLGTQWLVDDTTIPDAGQIDKTAVCTVDGAFTAAPNTITQILTPTRGWQTVTNPASATPGAPVETDAQLRVRQSQSTASNALAIVEGIYAGLANLPAVERVAIYVNDTGAPDINGVPGHSFSAVVDGGNIDDIAAVIANKKAPGVGTYGTTAVVVADSHGIENTINFFGVTRVAIHVDITIQSLAGYTASTGVLLRQAVVDFLNTLSIGEDSYLSRLFTPANLTGMGLGGTFVVTSIEQFRDSDPPAADDVVIAFNEVTVCALADVTLLVT